MTARRPRPRTIDWRRRGTATAATLGRHIPKAQLRRGLVATSKRTDFDRPTRSRSGQTPACDSPPSRHRPRRRMRASTRRNALGLGGTPSRPDHSAPPGRHTGRATTSTADRRERGRGYEVGARRSKRRAHPARTRSRRSVGTPGQGPGTRREPGRRIPRMTCRTHCTLAVMAERRRRSAPPRLLRSEPDPRARSGRRSTRHGYGTACMHYRQRSGPRFVPGARHGSRGPWCYSRTDAVESAHMPAPRGPSPHMQRRRHSPSPAPGTLS